MALIRHLASGIQYHLMTFSSALISWYEANKRDLPFRGTKDPYLLWVSEVILQQTRMDQGIDYYHRFIGRFPDIRTLAAASEEEVLKTWQGMGYYSRARNLHASAVDIVEKMRGVFPATYQEIIKLKGIGDYSAASIASLAFDEPHPAVDGNVFRFMARYFGFREKPSSSYGKKMIKEKAESLMDKDQPGTFNQAMIEFGALVCTPANPLCGNCIFSHSCFAFNHGLVRDIPLKTTASKPRIRYFHYLVITEESKDGLRISVKKRKEDDIWKNLYDFPLIEKTGKFPLSKLMETIEWRSIFSETEPDVTHISEEFKHLLSHQEIRATFYQVRVTGIHLNLAEFIPIEEIDSIPVPRLISLYRQKYFH